MSDNETSNAPEPRTPAPQTGRHSSVTKLPAPTPLPLVRRGYDPAAVDARINQLTAALQAANDAASIAHASQAGLEAELAQVRAELADTANPSFASLGRRANILLRIAEEQAAEIKQAAEAEAADIRSHAVRDATAATSSARSQIEAERAAHHAELDEHRSAVQADAERTRTLAQSEAEGLVAAAKAEADQIRLAAHQETTELRTAAQREVEQIRAGADREVQEARRMLAVEKERLTREATDHHTSAMNESRRLVEEAEGRAAAADERVRIGAEQIAQHRAEAKAESDALIARAKRDAEGILAAATAQAQSIGATATLDVERAVEAHKAELARLVKRRDAIHGQLAQLSELVSGFMADEPSDEAPAEQTAETPVVKDTKNAKGAADANDDEASA